MYKGQKVAAYSCLSIQIFSIFLKAIFSVILTLSVMQLIGVVMKKIEVISYVFEIAESKFDLKLFKFLIPRWQIQYDRLKFLKI